TKASAAARVRNTASEPWRSPNGPIPSTSPCAINVSTTVLWRGNTAMSRSIVTPGAASHSTMAFIEPPLVGGGGLLADLGQRLAVEPQLVAVGRIGARPLGGRDVFNGNLEPERSEQADDLLGARLVVGVEKAQLLVGAGVAWELAHSGEDDLCLVGIL